MVAAGGLKGRPGGGRRADDGGVLQQLQLPPSPRPSTAAAAASIDAAAPTRRPRRRRSRGLAVGCVLPAAALVLTLVVEPTAGAAYVLSPRLPSRRPPPVAGSSSGCGGATRRHLLASQRAGATALRSTIPNDDQQHLSDGRHLFEQHERLASIPSWRKPEPSPPIVDYLWGIPSLAMHAHSGQWVGGCFRMTIDRCGL